MDCCDDCKCKDCILTDTCSHCSCGYCGLASANVKVYECKMKKLDMRKVMSLYKKDNVVVTDKLVYCRDCEHQQTEEQCKNQPCVFCVCGSCSGDCIKKQQSSLCNDGDEGESITKRVNYKER